MANRTSAAAVVASSGTVLDEVTLVASFVTDANTYVNSRASLAGLGAATLELIERWIACHYCWTRDETLRIEKEKTGQSDVSLEGRDRFLRNAIALDPTGTIAEDFDPDSEAFSPTFEVAQTKRGSHFGWYE